MSEANTEEPKTSEGIPFRDLFAMGFQAEYGDDLAMAAGMNFTTNDEGTAWWTALPLDERMKVRAKLRYAFADAMLAARKTDA